MLKNLNRKILKLKSIEFGQICFYIGTLLLASTVFFAGIFYLISLIISFINNYKNKNDKKDILNNSLLICSIIFVLGAGNIHLNHNNYPIYGVLKNYSWDPSALWLGLFNWIPLFLVFLGFQIYLSKEKQRKIFAKCLFIGIIPVIISMFIQKLKIYGPFAYLNGLVIFYLKPIEELGGFAGLFNNPNYAGLWLSASLPFSFLILQSYKYKNIKFSFVASIIISTIYCILITNSRNSFIGIIISSAIMIGTKFTITFLIIFGILFFLILELSTIPFLNFFGIKEFLPVSIFEKILKTNYLNKLQFSRIDIWQKAVTLILERPLLGWGAATFPILYLVRGGVENAQHTHNMPLEIALTNGIPAAIILIVFVSYLVYKSWIYIFIKNKNSDSKINKAWITSLLIIIFSHLSDLTYYDGRVSLLIWILLAGLKSILNEEKIDYQYNYSN